MLALSLEIPSFRIHATGFITEYRSTLTIPLELSAVSETLFHLTFGNEVVPPLQSHDSVIK